MINIKLKPEHYTNAIKILIIMSLFFYIKSLNIPDNYKVILTVVPSLLLLTTNKVIDHFKYKEGNKPIVVRKDDNISDKYMSEEFLFDGIEPFTIETQPTSNAMIYEVEKPFWIKDGGYLDISNPSNFVKIDNLKLHLNYTMEFWLRLKNISNNNILYFTNNNKKILEIKYDDKFIIINDKNKIPYRENEWFHLVIMRGKIDTIGSNRGSMYINGIFNGYIENLPDLSNVNQSFLFKYNGNYIDFNKNYHDLSNCSIVRIYDRALTLDELQNNYLKDANFFGLENEDVTGRTYVQDKSLVFYLESRTNSQFNQSTIQSINKHKFVNNNKKAKIQIIKEEPIANVLFIDPVNISNEPKKDTIKKNKLFMFDLSNVQKSNRDWLTRAGQSLIKKENQEKKQNKVSKNESKEDKIIIVDETKNIKYNGQNIPKPDWILSDTTKSIEEPKKEKVENKKIKGEIVKKPQINKVEKPKQEKKEPETVKSMSLKTTKPIF